MKYRPQKMSSEFCKRITELRDPEEWNKNWSDIIEAHLLGDEYIVVTQYKNEGGEGVDIRNIFSWQVKAGDIDPFPMFGSNIRPLGLDENTMESRLDYLLEELDEEENPRLRKRSKELYLDIIKRYDMMNYKIRRY